MASRKMSLKARKAAHKDSKGRKMTAHKGRKAHKSQRKSRNSRKSQSKSKSKSKSKNHQGGFRFF